mmetsp:Transcript_25605/g.42582  ORF Transcript_25605/g.42582 Transcript_25605/m.42582 type:complete len:90 (+) Transcript_25605:52-321(+)
MIINLVHYAVEAWKEHSPFSCPDEREKVVQERRDKEREQKRHQYDDASTPPPTSSSRLVGQHDSMGITIRMSTKSCNSIITSSSSCFIL